MKTCRHLSRSGWRNSAIMIAALIFATAFCIPAFSASPSAASDEGYIELDYTSELPNLSDANALYSLADAHFGVYADYQCTQRAGELVTDEDGRATSSPLPAGRYFIKEELASPGFALSAQLYQVDVTIGASATIETSAMPGFSTPDVLVREVNSETGNPAGVAAAHLGGASYTISYYDNFDDDNVLAGPTRSWTFTSDDKGEVHLAREYLAGGSPLYEGPHETLVLPLGHYTVTIDHAPVGFIPISNVLSCDIQQQSRMEIEPLVGFEPFEESLQVMRGDFMFRKTDENGIALANVPFLLSYANGEDDGHVESHVIVTNEYGDYSSTTARIGHGMNTNANDAAILAHVDGTYKLDESKLTDMAGTWFSMDASGMRCNPDDTRAALPYGSYVLQELPCAVNEGMNLVTTQFSINRDGFTVKLDNIIDTRPAITGSAVDAQDADKLIRPVKDALANESVGYQNLIVGKSYRINCTAQVQSTGESVSGPDGSPAFASVELTPGQANGRIELDILLDTSELAGESIVMHLELVASDGMVVTSNGIDIMEQTLDVEPFITATALDATDLDNYVMGTDATILERISYDGLKPGRAYMASCTLNDKATGNALRDAQGKAITACVEFTPDSTEGSVDMELPVDTSGIAGHDIVAFDKLVDENGDVVANHQDIDDELQTVKTVKLSSNAIDKADGDKIFDANAQVVTITDTVNYANLVPGEQYEFKGVLMDKETGSVLSEDGVPIHAVVPFVPQEVSGSTDVEYSFDASTQPSQVLVAFETLEHDGKVIAKHTDLEDVAQTVTSSEVDPDAALNAPAGSSGLSGKGATVLTGDFWTRVLLMTLAMLAGTCICIAYALHRRRKTLEAIAHSDDPFV